MMPAQEVAAAAVPELYERPSSASGDLSDVITFTIRGRSGARLPLCMFEGEGIGGARSISAVGSVLIPTHTPLGNYQAAFAPDLASLAQASEVGAAFSASYSPAQKEEGAAAPGVTLFGAQPLTFELKVVEWEASQFLSGSFEISTTLREFGAASGGRLQDIDIVFFMVSSEASSSLPQTPAGKGPAYFLDTLYLLEATGGPRRAVQKIVDHMDDLLNQGRFSECDKVLGEADVRRLSAPLLVAFLGITRAAKKKLSMRPGFCARARAKLRTEVGPDRAERLLSSYG
jgi:hypothetical protein